MAAKQHVQQLSTVQAMRRRKAQLAAWLLACMTLAKTQLALAGGSLSEAEGTATWVLNIFSPALLLVFLTLLLIGCGLVVYFGRMSGQLFLKILIGSVLVFGARTIAPKIIALF